MSRTHGDKARFGKERKKKNLRRKHIQEHKKAMSEKKTASKDSAKS